MSTSHYEAGWLVSGETWLFTSHPDSHAIGERYAGEWFYEVRDGDRLVRFGSFHADSISHYQAARMVAEVLRMAEPERWTEPMTHFLEVLHPHYNASERELRKSPSRWVTRRVVFDPSLTTSTAPEDAYTDASEQRPNDLPNPDQEDPPCPPPVPSPR